MNNQAREFESKYMSTRLLTEEGAQGENLYGKSFPKKHRKPQNNLFLKLFCCCFFDDIQDADPPFDQKETVTSENPQKSMKVHHPDLVKSSVDVKNEKTPSEDSNPEGFSLKTSEDKPSSEQNFKALPPSSFLKKFSKKQPSSEEELNKDYPLNTLFFLFDANKTNCILAKITQKQLVIAEKEKSSSSNPLPNGVSKSESNNLRLKENKSSSHLSRYNDNPTNIFSLYEKGIKLDTDNWEKVCPEKLARYIAKKVKNSHSHLILDAFCGIGGNTIQLAKVCQFVMAVDICEKQILYLRHNSGIYGVNEKINGIIADYLSFQLKQVDLVFLNPPSDFKRSDNEKFSLFKHIKPDIIDILRKTLEISSNFIILLPRFYDFSELPSIFSQIVPSNVELEKHSIEIEMISINNSVEYVLIHFGKTCNVTFHEEIDFLNSFVNKDNHSKFSNNVKFLRYMTKKLGIQRIVSAILEAEALESSQCETLFQRFLDILRSYDFLTVEEQQEFLMDYIKHTSLLTSVDSKAQFRASTANVQSPIFFENPIFKKLDNENFSFAEQKKLSSASQLNVNWINNSPCFTALKKSAERKKSQETPKEKLIARGLYHLTPEDAQINKNPKSSNLTHKSEENNLPSFYSGRLFEPSANDHYIDANIENEVGLDRSDFRYNSLKLPLKKRWSDRFNQKVSYLEEHLENPDGERRESQSYH